MRNVEAAGCSLPACLCIPSGVSEFGALGSGVWGLGFKARHWLRLRNLGMKSGQSLGRSKANLGRPKGRVSNLCLLVEYPPYSCGAVCYNGNPKRVTGFRKKRLHKVSGPMKIWVIAEKKEHCHPLSKHVTPKEPCKRISFFCNNVLGGSKLTSSRQARLLPAKCSLHNFPQQRKTAVIWTKPVSTICQSSRQHSHPEADVGQEQKLMYATVSFNRVYAAIATSRLKS